MSSSSPKAVVLLGAQRFQPSLGACVSTLGVEGKIATITAGWQEREPEDEELAAHLDGRTVNLRLHARGDEVFRSDPELLAAHRARQDLLRHLQDLYRIRLESAIEAWRVLRGHAAPAVVRDEAEEAALEAIRQLDAWHLSQCARIRAEFEARWRPGSRPVVARHREEIAALIEGCGAIAIAGGHVANLINRLLLFGIAEQLGGRVLFAWSAGAMAVSERVVLFHDDPPQGPGASEVLDAGLGIVPRVVVLPEPERRLLLDSKDRVQLLARRFAPARCLAMPARASVLWQRGRMSVPEGMSGGVLVLRRNGGHGELLPRQEEA